MIMNLPWSLFKIMATSVSSDEAHKSLHKDGVAAEGYVWYKQMEGHLKVSYAPPEGKPERTNLG